VSSEQGSLLPGGGDVPLSQDQDYPQLLRELAEVMEGELRGIGIEPPFSAAVAETVTEHVRQHFGGQQHYWSKGTTFRQRKRRAEIWAMFNGKNYPEIAKRFGLGLSQAYRAVAVARAEAMSQAQPDLFTSADDKAKHERL